MDSVSIRCNYVKIMHEVYASALDIQDVMDVEKTVSPKMLLGEPNDRPWKDCPDLRCKTAGKAEDGPVWVAKPRERVVGIRIMDRANIILSFKGR